MTERLTADPGSWGCCSASSTLTCPATGSPPAALVVALLLVAALVATGAGLATVLLAAVGTALTPATG